MLATRARNHYRAQKKIALAGVYAVRRAAMLARTPEEAKAKIPVAIATYQLASALSGATAMAGELGRSVAGTPLEYVGTTALGFPLAEPVETIVDRLTADLDGQWQQLHEEMLASLTLMTANEVIAAGVDAASVEVFDADARWVRVLNLPSCKRCVPLAGRIYRSSEAFDRHIGCDCEHWPVGSEQEARDAGLVLDAREAFDRGQITGLSKADTRAIRDGADIATVVNASGGGGRRIGITNAVTVELFGQVVKATTYGTTKRAAWRKAHPNLPVRLRPQSIYEHARDREDALRLLRLYGYLT